MKIKLIKGVNESDNVYREVYQIIDQDLIHGFEDPLVPRIRTPQIEYDENTGQLTVFRTNEPAKPNA